MARKVKVCVIGSGSTGLFSLGQVRKGTRDFVVLDGGMLGTTCARVGCMPSKAIIQAAESMHQRDELRVQGISGGEEIKADISKVMQHVRDMRDGFTGMIVKRSGMGLGNKLIKKNAEFIGPNSVRVGEEEIEAENFILAVGSRPVMPEPWRDFSDLLMTTDEFFEQETLPQRMAIIGLGVIGTELGQSLARLGLDVTGIDMLETIGGLSDKAVREEAIRLIGKDFPLWLGAAAELSRDEEGLKIKAGERQIIVDKALVALGRRSNLDRLNLAAAGIALDERGMPSIDPGTMQIDPDSMENNAARFFVAGDATGDRQLMHEVADEARIAGYNAAVASTPRHFKRKKMLGITFTDPNICMVGQTWSSLEGRDDVVVGARNFDTQGRAKLLKKNRGLLHIYARRSDGLLLGAEMIVPRGEHLAHHLSWAIEQGLTVIDMLRLPFYHPVLEEGMENALYDVLAKVDEGGREPSDGIVELPFTDQGA
jgi:dihydrolipoamide dehydrogenase